MRYAWRSSVTHRRWRIASATIVVIVILAHLSLGPAVLRTVPPIPYNERHQYFKDRLVHTPRYLSRQSGAVSHHDTRFLSAERATFMTPDLVRASLGDLLSSYFETMDKLGMKETWIAHGTLLGYHWGGHILPWDTDIDMQISASNMVQLVESRYNFTVHPVPLSTRRTMFNQSVPARSPTSYLLDINPYWTTPKILTKLSITWDVANKIDARWIDMSNGKFVDITVAHEAPSGKELQCKDGHRYSKAAIYPLSASTLDGIKVRVPANPAEILADEYGKPALTNKNSRG